MEWVNGEGKRLMERGRGTMEGSRPPEISLTGENSTTETASRMYFMSVRKAQYLWISAKVSSHDRSHSSTGSHLAINNYCDPCEAGAGRQFANK
ncbi:hypothetical protein EVAR_94675_1 [Eumeta japonica]|uniref:Uncharacterized protein n=1 Tax=Eumeta variegata TaxID=151549 RepID=A0A4C1UVM9_EUMVA|nr:hypothetical protein EVAR_94675_1 [Eumeta japonica]